LSLTLIKVAKEPTSVQDTRRPPAIGVAETPVGYGAALAGEAAKVLTAIRVTAARIAETLPRIVVMG
jgi:hypothetical protein